MAQQINLYNRALRRRREWLSLSTVAIVALLAATLLLVVAGTLNWQTRGLRAEVQAIDNRLAGERIRLVQLSAQAGAVAPPGLAELQQQLAERREVLAALQARPGESEPTAGFADYLRGLARQSVAGLWLTGFAVAQGGQGMEIRGRMIEAASLPDYIRRLNAEPSFHGRQFVSLNVERPIDKAAPPDAAAAVINSFVLTAVVAPEAGKDKATTR